MNNASLELGGTNWAEKDGNILGYSVGDTSGKYSPQEFTFARGSNLSATRIDRAGLIVKGRENVLLQSNDFSNVAWDKNIISITSGQADKDGGTTASRLTANSGGQFRRLLQATNENSVVAASIFVKSGTADFVYMVHTSGSYSSGGYQFFDLANGTLGASSFLKIIDSKIEDAGNGWYRCTLVSEPDAIGNLYIGISNNDTNTNVTSGLYVDIQDAQLEQGLAASPYIPTTTTTAQAGVLENTPRLNYTTGVANPYLLLEPSRTNLFEQSEYFGSSYWVKTAAGTGLSPVVTNNYSISPDGNLNASRVVFDINSGTSSSDLTQLQSPSFVMAANYSNSVWLKSNTGTNYNFSFLKANGNVTAITVTSSWQRFENSVLSNVTTTPFRLRLRGSESTSSYADISIYGAQLEAGSYPTSYIPTYSVSATRAVDSCNKLDASGEIGQTEGTIFLDFKLPKVSTPQNHTWASLRNASENDRVLIYMLSNSTTLRAQIKASGTATNFALGSISDNERIKVAVAYKSGSTSIYVNGVSASGSSVALSFGAMDIIDLYNSQPFEGDLNQLQVFTTRLTNAELATLTTI